MLQEKIFKEVYKVIEDKVYAVIEETGQKRQLDGCEVRKFINEDIARLQNLRLELEKQLTSIIEQQNYLTQLDGQLIALGYCKIDSPLLKRVAGIVINDEKGNPIVEKLIHQQNCKNKRK